MIDNIEQNPDWAILTFSGLVTADEIFEGREAVINTPDFAKRKYHIWVFNSVEDIQLDNVQMQRIGHEDKINAQINPNIKIALVGNTNISFGMSRMYEGYANDVWPVGVFRTLEEAKAWCEEG